MKINEDIKMIEDTGFNELGDRGLYQPSGNLDEDDYRLAGGMVGGRTGSQANVGVGGRYLILDSKNGRILINDGTNDIILIGYQKDGF